MDTQVDKKFINFYCERCRKDWQLIAYLRWLNSIVGEAWQARCPSCEKKLIRLRDVHASQDRYFRKSRYTKMQLRKHMDSLVQPGDPRFNMLYPEVQKKIDARLDAIEREEYEKNQSL